MPAIRRPSRLGLAQCPPHACQTGRPCDDSLPTTTNGQKHARRLASIAGAPYIARCSGGVDRMRTRKFTLHAHGIALVALAWLGSAAEARPIGEPVVAHAASVCA